MKRREFIALLSGATCWPLASRAQQATPTIGVLGPGSSATFTHLVNAFHQGLQDAGYVQGKDVIVEYRWAQGRYDRLPELAAELVRRPVAVITTVGGTEAALAAKAATSTIPIVFEIGGDPVHAGLVGSLNRPGGNVTGISLFTVELVAKRLELLTELVPGASVLAMLVNPNNGNTEVEVNIAQTAAQTLGRKIHFVEARGDQDFDAAFENIIRQNIGALCVMADTTFASRRMRLGALATHHRVPAIYGLREHVRAGGLMSYGANLVANFRQVGLYTGRVLKGAKPADLPVVQPTKFELVINLGAAKLLGLTVPPTLLARADEVIE